SPVGPLTLVGDGASLTGLFMAAHRRMPPLPPGAVRDDAAFPEARRQLAEYFAGDRRAFSLEVRASGTAFQRAVWARLAELPFGETAGYGELAAALGRPGAARAVGMANARNPVSIVVPCHRVVGASGALTGYGGGL